MPAIKLITFDLDNTLWPVDAVIARAEEQCSQWLLERFPERAAVFSVSALRQHRLGLLADNPDYRHNPSAWRRDSILAVLQDNGLSLPEAKRQAEKAFSVFIEARNQVTLFPDARNTLETLASSYLIGAITNGNADLEKIGISEYFSFHHSAESVGIGKPAAKIFQAALESAQYPAHQALHIGDHPLEDIDAARALGFHTVWANLLEASWPEHHADADFVIQALADIPRLPLLQE